jgi:hypothetical protein
MRQSWTGVAVLAISVLSTTTGDAMAHRVNSELNVHLTVRVDNTVGAPAGQLKFAEARTAEVFAMSGVTVEWVDGADARRLNLAVPYNVVIMADAPRDMRADTSLMGQGMPLLRRAYVYYERVLQFGPVPPRDVVTTLGDVMAHELGHLLLPPGHSSLGIMRPTINMTSRRVETFTQAEGAEIRARLQRSEP